MTAFPQGVRLAQAEDKQRLMALCTIAHAENGYGSMDPDIVAAVIQKAVDRQGSIIAIIDGPERIEAAIGLQPSCPWFCKNEPENWYWSELFWYVHPLHRRSRHAFKLFQFAQWWEEQIQAPVLISLMPREDLEKKERLCARFGTRIGSTFLIGKRRSYSEVAGNA